MTDHDSRTRRDGDHYGVCWDATACNYPDCPFCHGAGDCLECDPETAWT